MPNPPTQPNTQEIIDPPANDVPNPDPPPRAKFTESKMEGEPPEDRMLVLEDGTKLRERMVRIEQRADRVMADDAAPTEITWALSNALLGPNGKVVYKDEKPVIAPIHEVKMTLEALGRLGSQEAVDAAMMQAREEAAAMAALNFKGAALLDTLDRN